MKYSALKFYNLTINFFSQGTSLFTFSLFIIQFLTFNVQQNFAQKINEFGSPFIRNYTPAEYNAETQNWAIVQDKRGVMYFGNNIGILEFDGINWKLIKVPNNSIIRSLAMEWFMPEHLPNLVFLRLIP